MRTRTFSEQEKIEIKQRMMDVGLPMLREKGITHMSINKLTSAAGIGKSTFYNFYASKEEFVNEMLGQYRKRMLEGILAGLNGREKYSCEEGKEMIRSMILNAEHLYQHFSIEDELALKKLYEKNGQTYLDLGKEKKVIDFIAGIVEGVKKELDYAVISNLMKIMVFSSEQKELLHESGYGRTLECMVELLLDLIFEE